MKLAFLQPSAALGSLVGAVGGASIAALAWSVYEAWRLVGDTGDFGQAWAITATAASVVLLASVPLCWLVGWGWRRWMRRGYLGDLRRARPARAAIWLGAAVIMGLALSYATLGAAVIAGHLFASEQVRIIALTGSVPVIAAALGAIVWWSARAVERGLAEAQTASTSAVVGVGLAGGVAATLWAASLIGLFPHVFDQLDLRAYVPVVVILAAGMVASVVDVGRAGLSGAGLGCASLGVLVVFYLAGQTPQKIRLRLDQHAPGSAWVLDWVQPASATRPQPPKNDGKSAVCSSGQPTPTAEGVGTIKKGAPDIILVTVDALRWDHTSMSGHDRDTTPHLNEHGKKGAVFTQAHSTNSTTRQTFRSLFSGVYSSRVEAPKSTKWGLSFADDQLTLASYLSAAGYQTVALSSDKGAFPEKYGAFRGFDVADESAADVKEAKGYSAPYKIDRIISYLSDPDVGKPTFVWTHLLETHQWYNPGPDPVHYGKDEPEQYDEAIHFVDDELDRLLEFARGPDRHRRTIVVVTADHGQAFFEHGYRYHGASVYEEETHVPLLVWGPHVRPGRYDTPVSLIDVVPTILDMVGLKPPEALCGTSLRPALVDGHEPEARPVYLETLPDDTWDFFQVGLLRGSEKVLVRPPKDAQELFDLADDPSENHDLSESEPDRLHAGLDRLRRFYRTHGLEPADYGL